MFKKILMLGGIILILCIALTALGLFLLEKERGDVKEAYGENVADMCDPPAGGQARFSLRPEGDLKAAVLEVDDSLWHEWHEDLPDNLRADDRDSLGVVICVEEGKEVIERCPYQIQGEDGDFTVIREQTYAELIYLNAETGERFLESRVTGGEPDECPDTFRAREGSTQTLDSPRVEFNDFFIEVNDVLRGE